MRVAAGLSQLQLGTKLGIHNAQLSKMEVGRIKVPLTALLSAAKICGFRVALLPERGEPILVEAPQRYVRSGQGRRRSSESSHA
ncbi:MAG: helix-turn-helix transcriptional regulator [Deltaproteobacteria bacterium]|nr:helix-turn-helix transcriptional regulator [Deltaproteobacteria bacterium]